MWSWSGSALLYGRAWLGGLRTGALSALRNGDDAAHSHRVGRYQRPVRQARSRTPVSPSRAAHRAGDAVRAAEHRPAGTPARIGLPDLGQTRLRGRTRRPGQNPRQLVGGILDQFRQTLGNVGDALRNDDAELGQQPAEAAPRFLVPPQTSSAGNSGPVRGAARNEMPFRPHRCEPLARPAFIGWPAIATTGPHHDFAKITGNATCTSSAPPAEQRMRRTAVCTYL